MRRPLLVLVAVLTSTVLLATACSSGGDGGADGPASPGTSADPVVSLPEDLELTAMLQPFDSCEAVLEHVKTEALSRVGPYGLDGGVIPFAEGTVTTAAAEEDQSVAGGSDDAGGGDLAAAARGNVDTAAQGTGYSTTNVQEEGVDEPDILKSDGRRIVALARGGLNVVDVSGPAPVLLGSLELSDFWARDMFLSGDRVLLLGDADLAAIPLTSRIYPPGDMARGAMRLVEVDISDPSAPRLVGSTTITGSYLNARMVGTAVRIVAQEWGPALDWVYPEEAGGEAAAAEANREVVRQSAITDWLPGYVVVGADGSLVTEGTAVPCERVHRPESFAGLSTVTVATVDLAAGLGSGPIDAVSVFGAGDTVYASPTGLYVTTNDWGWLRPAADVVAADGEASTQVHRFDISDPARTGYVASGAVPGYILNQWALDEHDGYLRVATTTSPPWGDPAGEAASQSMVSVLATDGDQLVPVGRVEGLGRGERIFAVRYFDDLATVVTFRQTDPLYTIDLSDPANPRLLGELKIPGYSAYLHPIGANRVLGVGQDATEEGFTTGTQVSVFDLTDLANPQRLGTWNMAGSATEAEWDSRAFLWWDPSDLAVIPVNEQGGPFPLEDDIAAAPAEPWFGAVGLRVGEDGSLAEVGRVSQQAPSAPRTDCWVEVWPATEIDQLRQWMDPEHETIEILGEVPGDPSMVNVRHCNTYIEADWAAQVRRSAVVADRLYTLSDKGLLASGVNDMAPVGAIEFPVFEQAGGFPRPIEG